MTWWQQLLEVALRASWLVMGISLVMEHHPIAGLVVVFIERYMEVSWPEGPVDKLNRAVHDDPQQQEPKL